MKTTKAYTFSHSKYLLLVLMFLLVGCVTLTLSTPSSSFAQTSSEDASAKSEMSLGDGGAETPVGGAEASMPSAGVGTEPSTPADTPEPSTPEPSTPADNPSTGDDPEPSAPADNPAEEIFDLAQAEIDEIEDQIYADGDFICPSLTIRLNGKLLVESEDYSVTYQDNQNAGTATVFVYPLANYTGATSCSFSILPIDIAQATMSVSSVLYNGKEQKPKPSLSYHGKTLVEGTDYELSWANNINAGTAQVTASGKGNFSSSKTANFMIRRQVLSAVTCPTIANQTYTGKKITPELNLSYEGMRLVEGKDYQVLFNNNLEIGTATAVLTGTGNYVGPQTLSFKIVPQTKPMYRLYNPNSGEHFYTASAYERDVLKKAGWRYEGIGWYAPLSSKTPVYRLYNKNAGDHHYTVSAAERNALVGLGWRYEGIGWYSDDAKGVALYRQYNPNARTGTHNYTTNKAENDMLVSLGWRAEGIGWYGVKL